MTAGSPWADSARKLLDALRPPGEAPAGAAAAPGAGAPAESAHGADCRWCPVCQAAAVLRGERPEVTAALADVLATTAAVLRDLAGEPARSGAAPAAPAQDDDEHGHEHGGEHGGEDGGGPGAGTVQRIEIA